MSNNEISQSSSFEYSFDESALVFSGSKCLSINILRIPSELLTSIVDTLLKDAAQLFDLISDHPLAHISGIKGIIYDEDSAESSEWIKVKNGTQYSILEAATQNSSLYLIQHRSGKANVTIDISDQELIDRPQLATTNIDFGQLAEIGEAIHTKEVISAVILGDQRLTIDDLHFHDECRASYILVRSKALGDHLLYTSCRDGLDSNNVSFMGCFALIDVLLVAEGDIDRARRLLDVAAERATLVRDYIDLAEAADLLGCSSAVTDALVRRAIVAMRNDDRNSHLNLRLIPELAQLCCSRATGGNELAFELLNDLIVAEPDPRTLREAAEIATRYLHDLELARNLNETALKIIGDNGPSD